MSSEEEDFMAYWIVFVAVLARFAPHPPNFSPVFAALIFGGTCLRKRDSIWFPVVALAASDYLLTAVIYGEHFGWMYLLDWTGFAAVAMIGWWLRDRITVRKVFAAALAGPAVFFVVSNFAVWLGGGLYPPNLSGLTACYVAALPFFANSLVAGLLFSGVLFGGYEFYRRRLQRTGTAGA
jgi:Family of unknown function (DUF6580)